MAKLNKEKLERKLKKYLKENKFENAIKTANRLSKMFPDEIEYILTKAECFEALEDYYAAVKEYKNVLKISKDDIHYYCFIHRRLVQIGMFEDALELVEKGLKIDPKHEMLVLNKVDILVELDMIDEVCEYVDGLLKTSDYWKELLLKKAQLELGFGNIKEAIDICDEILDHEMDMDVLTKKIDLLDDLGLFDEALDILNSLLDDEEHKSWAIANKTILYNNYGESDKALSLIDEFLMENPNDVNGNYAKGKVLLDMEKFDEAEKYLRGGFEGNDHEISYLVANTFFKAENFEIALEILESIPVGSKLIPEGSEFYQMIQMLKNQIYEELNEISDLEDQENRENFSTLDPRTPSERIMFQGTEAYDLINEAWAENNSLKARKLARKALKLDKYAIDAYNVLAFHASDDEEWKNYYKKAIDLFHETHDEDYFEEFTGSFWRHMETRPFMRAMEGLANALNFTGNEKEAADLYEYMLELDSRDHQYVRYTFMNVLLSLDRLDEVANVLNQFDYDNNAQFLFSKLLWAIKSNCDEKSLKKLFHEATESNEYIVPFLFDHKLMPPELPRIYRPGEPSEAAQYLFVSYDAWKDEMALKTLRNLAAKYGRR